MKKILVGDKEEFRETIKMCMRRWESDLGKSKHMTSDMLESLSLHHALDGDVVEFEAQVDMWDLPVISLPFDKHDFKHGDKLHVFAIKQEEK